MKCPKSKFLSPYHDNELSVKDKTFFEDHLKGCALCSGQLEELRSLRAALANSERHQAPYGFAMRVIARTAEMDKKKAPWLAPFSIRFAEAAVLVVVITMGIIAGRVMTNSSPAAKTPNIVSSLSLDLFDAAPPGSLGGAYLVMTEVGNEK